MWESVQVSAPTGTYRGRYRVEAGRLVLEWTGGRTSEWLGILKPELVATMLLKKLVGRMPLAA